MMRTLNSWPCGHAHPELSGLGAALGAGQPPPPGVCCQLDQAGNTVCSDGNIFPPGCPKAPATNVPGQAEYYNDGGVLRPTPPPPGSCAPGAVSAPPGAAPAPTPATAPAPVPQPVVVSGGKNSVVPWLGLIGAGVITYFLLDS